MLGGTVINVEILVGLPGSGKTYYADNKSSEYAMYHMDKYLGEKPKNKRQVYSLKLDYDEYKDKYPNLSKILGYYGYHEVFMFHPESIVICDGLFLTNDSQEKIVSEWVELFNEEGGNDQSNKLNIKFVYFNENREGCLNNDSYRDKKRSANVTIKHSPFEKPNIEALKDKFNQENINFEIEEKEVYVMSKYEGTFKPLRNEYWSKKLGKDILASESWSTGGNVCDCWGGDYSVRSDKTPESFEKFDKLLEKYCPNVTFLKYKNIYSSCVTIEEDHEDDYYGGREYYNTYCCDLKKLYEMLTELGYLKDKED